MQSSTEDTVAATVVRTFPTAPNHGELTLRQVIGAYLAAYVGRDESIHRRLAYWAEIMGDVQLRELDSDAIADALDHLGAENIRKYVGRDDSHRPVFRECGRRAPATVNRYR